MKTALQKFETHVIHRVAVFEVSSRLCTRMCYGRRWICKTRIC